ncbi:inter-alpha-trypsin inhibitor heavy chain H3-like isoform X2 [Anneissia japonica]|uniref:inter-alpha-trypsin inhibitor heavy chain H3-like isoform X2 n=1 Tax=Anneissia japonica TaxID=1529436 RepID=UPI00142563AD|nr:inter-alpha-trypsin inhibitor heavy chain H3-like isoform X2 [Anneissia japonica]
MMGRLSLLVLVCITWFGSLVVKQSWATPLAVVAPLTGVEQDTHIDEEDLALERGERDVGSGYGKGEKPKSLRKPEIAKLQIRGAVTSRFASTTVTSILRNRADESAEAVFLIRLPTEAFIANFSMEIDGVVYPAEIKEKEKAQKIYNEARDRGQSAGHVKQQSEKVNSFSVSVSVAKKTFVTFELIYQEMLTRKDGYFEHRTSIRPGQIVKSMNVKVAIIETQGLSEVNTSWVKEQANGKEVTKHGVGELILKGGDTRAFIEYAPTVEEQRQESEDGIQGDFVIRYDVNHPKSGGELQIVNGYFVHYFSPEGLPVVRKNVVFVIDVSGSMSGRKIQQTKDAMNTILDDLRDIDYFNIVTFTDYTRQWKNTLQQATPENIRRAKNFVSSLRALAGTNLHEGLIDGVRLLKKLTENANDSIHGVSMLIMLTDGQPTSGVTDLNAIERDVEREINNKYSLFNLGFGENVDYKFLEKLALRNRGLARKIYDDSKASLQLEGFFDEVATPLLYNVVFDYPEKIVETNSLTQTVFPNYFQGTELVVTGKLKATNITNEILEMTIAANSVDVAIEFPLTVDTEKPPEALLNKHAIDDFAERLWAYLSIKDLLRRRGISNSGAEKEELKQQALKLSLEYHFVTPLTSLIVVKPEEDKPEYIASNKEEQKEADDVPSGILGVSRVSGAAIGQRQGKMFASNLHIGPSRSMGSASSYGGRLMHTSPTFADGDPHFMVHVPQSDMYVCFNIMGLAGDNYRLIQDPEHGITVTGNIIEEPFIRPGKLRKRSYFGDVTFVIGNKTIIVSPLQITFDEVHTFTWDYNLAVGFQDLSISIVNKRFVRVNIQPNITLVAMRHAVTGNNIMKVGYMGVYIENGQGLSENVHGLIGQFQDSNMSIDSESIRVNDQFNVSATLNIKSREVPVTKRYHMVLSKKQPCWFAGNNGAGLIDGSHVDYLEKTNIVNS